MEKEEDKLNVLGNSITSEIYGSGDDEHGDKRHDCLGNVPEGDNHMNDTAVNKLDVLGDSIDHYLKQENHVSHFCGHKNYNYLNVPENGPEVLEN